MKWLLGWLAGMSVLAFVFYGVDKQKAIHHAWRIRESTLLLLAFAGGALGALFGMYVFHHKTRHWKFRLLVPLALVLWCLIAGYAYETVK